jgi:hypothetical protein
MPLWPWALLDTLWHLVASWCLRRVSRTWAIATAGAYLALPQGWLLARAWICSLLLEAMFELWVLWTLPSGPTVPQVLETASHLYFVPDACTSMRAWRFFMSLGLGLLLWCRIVAFWMTSAEFRTRHQRHDHDGLRVSSKGEGST